MLGLIILNFPLHHEPYEPFPLPPIQYPRCLLWTYWIIFRLDLSLLVKKKFRTPYSHGRDEFNITAKGSQVGKAM